MTIDAEDPLKPDSSTIAFESVTPVLRVADIDASVAFYEALGFREEWRHQLSESLPRLMGLEQQGLRLMLTEHAVTAPGAVVYFDVRGVDALAMKAIQNGLTAEFGPSDQAWGKREVYFRDDDGNLLRFGETVPGP